MEIHLETDAQFKAPPPCIVDDHIRDRVSRLERQLKTAHALVQLGDIILQAGVLALTGQHLDVGQMAPHFVFQSADVGVELLRLMDTRPDRLCLLPLTAKNNVERILGVTGKEKNRDRQQEAR